MVKDYLLQLEAINVESLKKQERDSLVTILNYLGRRENNPYLLHQIKKNIDRIHGAAKN